MANAWESKKPLSELINNNKVYYNKFLFIIELCIRLKYFDRTDIHNLMYTKKQYIDFYKKFMERKAFVPRRLQFSGKYCNCKYSIMCNNCMQDWITYLRYDFKIVDCGCGRNIRTYPSCRRPAYLYGNINCEHRDLIGNGNKDIPHYIEYLKLDKEKRGNVICPNCGEDCKTNRKAAIHANICKKKTSNIFIDFKKHLRCFYRNQISEEVIAKIEKIYQKPPGLI